MRLGGRFERLEELQIALEVSRLEARLSAAQVVRRNVLERAHAAGEQTAPERCIGDEGDAEGAACGQDLLFDIARPKRIFGLQGADWMHRAGARERLRPGLGEPE